jgi:surface protein
MSNVKAIKDTINIRVVNNTAFAQSVNLLGGTSDPLGIPPHLLYQWDLSGETYFGTVTVDIVISSTANPTPVTYTVPVDGFNIEAVAFALNTLNLGNFQVNGNIIYVTNDFYIYGALTVLSTAFVSTWQTATVTGSSSASNQIQLPLDPLGTYNFIVYWGDGTQDTITSWNQAETLHTYATAGIYTIGIAGTIVEWSFGNAVVNDNRKLISISSWGTLQFGIFSDLNFYQCINLELLTVTDVPDFSATTALQNAFDGCTSLTTINRSNEWDTSNIQNMIATFADCSALNTDISSWDVSNCTDMNAMFYNCQVFNSDISGWDVSQNTSMYAMFINAQSFNQPIGSWDVSSVTTMQEAFTNALSFNQPINSWDVSNVTTMLLMFSGATSFNQPLNSWNTSSVINMSNMFLGATAFNSNIASWNVTSVTNMQGMFSNATAFNQAIGSWTLTSATNLSSMFFTATSFNQPLNGWGASLNGVTNMTSMFRVASVFNQSLNSWDTSTVTNMSLMFTACTAFNGNITSWNVSSVTNMQGMFTSATAFNQNISGWNVANVQNFNATFSLASAFNQPIGSWNVGSATNMAFMFAQATAFNQNIGSWNVASVSDFSNFMQSKTFLNYSTANLDAIYNGWSLLTVQPNLANVDFNTIKYTLAGQAGKNILTGAPNNWVITDGGI